MKKCLVSVVLCFAMLLGTTLGAMPVPAEQTKTVEEIVNGMTLDEKISQMIIPSIKSWEAADVTDLSEAYGLDEVLQKHQYGGIILYSKNIKDTEQTTRLVSDLQKNNAQIEATTKIPYFMPVDEEGGSVVRVSTGTRMTGNMAIGATGPNAETNAKQSGTILGEEIAALGFNVDFAPDIDVNSNPSNPVIGTRSFSDDPSVVASLGVSFNCGLEENQIISTYKHFPGHGDTDTDSHIGTPAVYKTLTELEQTELVPFRAAIDNGAEMIMTAHITLPQIDVEETLADGTQGYFPATMSSKIIGDILRGRLGYDGVIITDSLEMDAIAGAKLVPGEEGSAEYSANIAEKVINAGVDILLRPADLNTPEKATFYDDYIRLLVEKVKNKEISEERVNKSVTRILSLKKKYGILDLDTSGDDIDQKVDHAKEVVGAIRHHAAELDIAHQAVTLVKNEKNTLPFDESVRKIVLVGKTANDPVLLQYAVTMLKEQGVLPEDTFVNNLAAGTTQGSASSGTHITIDYYFTSSEKPPRYSEKLKKAVKAADAVVVISASSGLDDLSPSAVPYRAISDILKDTHSSGGTFTLLSSNLPYDCARYQDADAILLTYMSSGTGVDPTERTEEGNTGAFNANLYAAICDVFGNGSPTGTLPVNIPRILVGQDGSLSYSDELLYPRGYGLLYADPNTKAEQSPIGKVELSQTAFSWNGKKRFPKITVKGKDGIPLPADGYRTELFVRCEGGKYQKVAACRNVGIYRVKVTGRGIYTGSAAASFKIVPAGTSVKAVKAKSRSFTVIWKKQAKKMSSSRITGYQVQIATDKKFKKVITSKKIKGYKKVSKTFSKLKGKKKYYVRVRTYKIVNGKTLYSAWSAKKAVTTKK